jgi:hypothetical protein
MEGSSPLASVTGPRVRVNGPFPSGTTFVQIGYVLPLKNGTLELTQPFPAALDHLGVIVKKVATQAVVAPHRTPAGHAGQRRPSRPRAACAGR